MLESTVRFAGRSFGDAGELAVVALALVDARGQVVFAEAVEEGSGEEADHKVVGSADDGAPGVHGATQITRNEAFGAREEGTAAGAPAVVVRG